MSRATEIASTIMAQADGAFDGGMAMALPAYTDGIRGGIKVMMDHCAITVRLTVLDLYDVTVAADRYRTETANLYGDQIAEFIKREVRMAERMAA